MSESMYLDDMKTPRELERARQKKWRNFALITAASALALGGLELLYTSPLLPMFGLRVVVRPYWHYITAVPVIIALHALLKMLVTLPAHRKELAFNTNVFAIARPMALQAAMRRRYERSRRDGEKLGRKASELRRKLIKEVALTLLFAGLGLLADRWTLYIDFVPKDIVLLTLVAMAPYAFGMLVLMWGMESCKIASDWLEASARSRDQRQLESDLALIRREIHGEEVGGALSTVPQRLDDSGDLSLHHERLAP